MREVSKILDGSSVVGAGGQVSGFEYTDVMSLPVETDSCLPKNFTFAGSPLANALKPGRVITPKLLISAVLDWSAWSQVVATVVQSVIVLVVRVNAFVFCNDSVHVDCRWLGELNASRRIVLPVLAIEGREPIPLHQEFVVACVHYSVKSASEWNIFDRLVRRLDNRVSLHADFHREPPIPSEIVRPLSILGEAA